MSNSAYFGSLLLRSSYPSPSLGSRLAFPLPLSFPSFLLILSFLFRYFSRENFLHGRISDLLTGRGSSWQGGLIINYFNFFNLLNARIFCRILKMGWKWYEVIEIIFFIRAELIIDWWFTLQYWYIDVSRASISI